MVPVPIKLGGTGQTTAQYPNISYVTTNNTVTASTGSVTSSIVYTAYNRVGQWVDFTISAVINTNGTAAGVLIVPLPFPAAKYFQVGARQVAGAGKLCIATIPQNATVQVLVYDGTYPGGDGANINISGRYEVASGS